MWPWLPERVVVVHIPCVLTPYAERMPRADCRSVLFCSPVVPRVLRPGTCAAASARTQPLNAQA